MVKKKWESPALGRVSHRLLRIGSMEVRHGGSHPAGEGARSSASEGKADHGERVHLRPRLGSPPEALVQCLYPCLEINKCLKDHLKECKKMETCLGESRHEGRKSEISENIEAANEIEKYNVPLNSLKMMFEEGEPTPSKQILRARAAGQVEGGSLKAAVLRMMWR